MNVKEEMKNMAANPGAKLADCVMAMIMAGNTREQFLENCAAAYDTTKAMLAIVDAVTKKDEK